MRRLLLLIAMVLLAGCDSQGLDPPLYVASDVAHVVATSTTAPPPAIERHITPPRAARSDRPTATTARYVAPVGMPDDAFWWRLSHGCECKSDPDGCPHSGGWFQFKGSTATKVGYRAGTTYADQLAMAKYWLGRIGVAAGGTTSGWPVCWHHAARTG